MSMAEESEGIWLTQSAYDKLEKELTYLSGDYREEIAHRIAVARDEGDLKENGGYHAAREEQGKNEARIRELKAKLRDAKIGTPPDNGVAEPGSVVTADVDGDEMTFLLGSREMADTTDLDVFSPSSPLGGAVNGARVGSTVSYETPTGATINVLVKSAHPYQG